jgi:glycerate-2-kinase
MLRDDICRIGASCWTARSLRRIMIAGAGKAAAAMTAGLLETLRPWCAEYGIQLTGQIHVPAGETNSGQSDLPEVDVCRVRPLTVNLPTEAVVQATRRLQRRVSRLGNGDLCVGVISGGGSALLCRPFPQVSLASYIGLIEILSERGADIRQMNVVRQCFDQIKAGGLATACHAEHRVALLLSDVIGDDPALIASGPLQATPRLVDKALHILSSYRALKEVDEGLVSFLRQHLATGPQEPANRSPVPHLVIGNPAKAVAGAARQARHLGYRVISEVTPPPEPLEDKARQLVRRLAASPPGACLISAGEPTLTLLPRPQRGLGGRNQHLVLTCLQHWLQQGGHSASPFCLLSGGTDGEDGGTDVAGGWCDHHAVTKFQAEGINIDKHLQRQDAGRLLQASRLCWRAAPTGTNVCDLRVLIRH